MDVDFAHERRPNTVDELLNVIRNSERGIENAERENMRLREYIINLNTQGRSLVDELLKVIGNSETRREIAERENMRLREYIRNLNTQGRQLTQTNERPETSFISHSPQRNARPRVPTTIRPTSPL